jgi:hypothetical protein
MKKLLKPFLIVAALLICVLIAPWVEVYFFPQKANVIYATTSVEVITRHDRMRGNTISRSIKIKYAFLIDGKIRHGEATRYPGNKIFDAEKNYQWVSSLNLFEVRPCEVHYCSWWPACHILKVKE